MRDIRQSITTKWIFGVFSIVVASVVIAVVVLCLVLSSYIKEGIAERLPEYVAVFDRLSSADKAGFNEAAVGLTENFENMDKVKVVVFNAEGQMVASTDGFVTDEQSLTLPEYKTALDSRSGTARWTGTDTSGQPIMATTVIIKNTDGEITGSYRYLISMRPYEKTVSTYNLMICAVGIVMIVLSGVSGIYFIRSIVTPVRQVTVAAQKIAKGDLNTRLKASGSGEIGELCDTINFMAEELGKTEALKNDFISSVSHELRTPLTAIKGWGETVNMSIGYDDETVKRGIDVMLTETDRLAKLVEELLDFSRMQTGKLRVEMITLDIGPVLEEVVGMYEELAKQQGVTVTFIPPVKRAIVTADRDRIKQVFVNVIDNAVKYTPAGGDVIVSVYIDAETIKITVCDTGVGIPAEDIEHVKEKFYKANKTVRGSGIGLAVADEIVKQHGGSITVESSQGVGTNVTIEMPYNKNI